MSKISKFRENDRLLVVNGKVENTKKSLENFRFL